MNVPLGKEGAAAADACKRKLAFLNGSVLWVVCLKVVIVG